MPFSDTAKATMLDALPNTVYAAFFSGGAPGVGTEVVPATLFGSGNRPSVVLGAAASGARTPTADEALGTVAANTSVTHIAMYDAATAGNLLGHEAYARDLVIGDVVSILDAANVFAINDS
jgi:hypothetical protein